MKNHEELIKDIEDLQKHINGSYSELDQGMAEGTKKLISCKHEIVFNIRARVLEEDDTGQTVGTKSICVKNYHIPVPSDKDYDIYMKTFFDHLEKCISASAKQAKESENNQ